MNPLVVAAVALFVLARRASASDVVHERPLEVDMSSAERIATLAADVAEKARELLLRAPSALGRSLVVTEGRRTQSRQDALWCQGRPGDAACSGADTAGPQVTWTRRSQHLTGRAFDVAFLVNGRPSWDESHPWEALGALGESLGLTWGGRWQQRDRPHFEA